MKADIEARIRRHNHARPASMTEFETSAAMEQPELLARDMRAFFAKVRKLR
jgi:hypothetical protein